MLVALASAFGVAITAAVMIHVGFGEAMKPLVIAHRGASASAPENTRVAIDEAIRQGADLVEVAVRQTADGELVLFHDEDLKRLAGRKGDIETSDWATVREFDVGSWFGDGRFAGERPPLLGDAIRRCLDAGVGILVEHKSGDPEAYARVIEASAPDDDRVIVLSPDPDFLVSFRGLVPDVTTAVLGGGRLSESRLATIEALAPGWVAWKAADLKPSGFRRLREGGFRVALWTVNQRARAMRWIERGVDALITDRPGDVREWVNEGSREEK